MSNANFRLGVQFASLAMGMVSSAGFTINTFHNNDSLAAYINVLKLTDKTITPAVTEQINARLQSICSAEFSGCALPSSNPWSDNWRVYSANVFDAVAVSNSPKDLLTAYHRVSQDIQFIVNKAPTIAPADDTALQPVPVPSMPSLKDVVPRTAGRPTFLKQPPAPTGA